MPYTNVPPAPMVGNSVAFARPARAEGEARRSARALIVTAGVLVALALAPVGVGLASAVVLYEVSAPPYAWLSRRMAPRFAAALSVLAVLVIIVGPAVWIGQRLSGRLPVVMAAIANWQHLQKGRLSGTVEWLAPRVAHVWSSAADWLPGELVSVSGRMAWGLINWSIALLGLYYLLGSASASWPRLARVLPLSPIGAETLRVRLRNITQGIVAGTLLSAVIQGAAISVGFWLAGIPEALFWGACAAIFTLLPVLGNILVWLPGLLLMVVQQHLAGAIAIAVFGGLMPPIIDRVVRASVSRRVGNVHPMITLVGALAGMRVAGVAGIMLGPVVLAMFVALAEVYSQEYLPADATD